LAIAIKLPETCYKGVKIKPAFRPLDSPTPIDISDGHRMGRHPFSRNTPPMAVDSQRGRLIFQKMERDLRRLASDLNPDSVHGFRTTTRRLQTLIEELMPERTRNQKKLLQMLNRIRKRAGKVRDIDAQLAALRSLKIAQEPRRKTQLTHSLLELRAKHEKRLSKLLKKQDIREIKTRLHKAARVIDLKSGRDPVTVAAEFAGSVAVSATLDEPVLHQYRLAVKRARYAAELASPSRESTQLIAQLKKLQDALGSWHDWTILTHTAIDHFGEVNQSSLVAALQNVTGGKFRHAVSLLPRPQAQVSKVAPSTHLLPVAKSAA
jgi:CHAD domain-containing protein